MSFRKKKKKKTNKLTQALGTRVTNHYDAVFPCNRLYTDKSYQWRIPQLLSSSLRQTNPLLLLPTMASMALAVTSIPMVSNSLSFSRSPSVTSVPLSHSSSSISLSALETSPISPLIYCGRGDKKTAKGKRFNHSFGNARPRNKKKGRGPPRVPVPPAPPRKDKYDDGEVVKIEIDESLFSN
ncbi:putative 30S ribosomal protein [Helianthus annuus]|nr:putative 30S ribosomal protein [Helianthus annuus]